MIQKNPGCCTCADVVADALHRDDRISYSTTLPVPHDAFDPTKRLHATSMTNESMCESCLKFPPSTPISLFNTEYIARCDDTMIYDV